VGIPYLIIPTENLKGKIVVKVDVSNEDKHTLILKDIPLSPQEQKIEELENLVADLSQVLLGVD
jgi:hypothetical protein